MTSFRCAIYNTRADLCIDAPTISCDIPLAFLERDLNQNPIIITFNKVTTPGELRSFAKLVSDGSGVRITIFPPNTTISVYNGFCVINSTLNKITIAMGDKDRESLARAILEYADFSEKSKKSIRV